MSEFLPVHVNGTLIGHGHEAVTSSGNKVYCFFGNAEGTFDRIKSAFPNFQLARLKQVHGDACVETDGENVNAVESAWPIADAHATETMNVALCILTADCIPFFATDGNTIVGVHSGWRGTLKNIIGKALQENFKPGTPLSCFIGPHILWKSFEVDLDLANQFQEFYRGLGGSDRVAIPSPFDTPGKGYVDLQTVALQQVKAWPGSIKIFSYDTKTSSEWASYRRDGANAGRNISFISKIS